MKKGIYWFMQLVSAELASGMAGPRDSSNVGSSLVISVFWLYPEREVSTAVPTIHPHGL